MPHLGDERNPAGAGLCGDCQHCRIVNTQRSTFYMCRLALTNPEYRKYPPIPVVRCAGYVPVAERSGGDGTDGKLTE